ncbi:hypothetical protein TNCV_2268431 [Trichonephila clavipes]|nr:hypothetical protein TNCV_2268431 [Trichonephila clavipes]
MKAVSVLEHFSDHGSIHQKMKKIRHLFVHIPTRQRHYISPLRCEKVMLVGARLPGMSVSRTVDFVSVSRITMSRVMTVYTQIWVRQPGVCSSVEHQEKHFMLTTGSNRETLNEFYDDYLHHMLQILSLGERSVFQDDNASVHTSRSVQTWLQGYDDEVIHLTWCPQSSLSVYGFFRQQSPCSISSYAYYLTSRLLLHVEYIRIPMICVRDIYLSIPRQMQAVNQVKRESLAKAIVILNRGQGTKTTPDLVTLFLNFNIPPLREFGLRVIRVFSAAAVLEPATQQNRSRVRDNDH